MLYCLPIECVSEPVSVYILPYTDGRFNGSRAVLSGPAGGVVGYALTTYNAKTGQSVIGFDMGGESSLFIVTSSS